MEHESSPAEPTRPARPTEEDHGAAGPGKFEAATLRVTSAALAPSTSESTRNGLLGWITLVLNNGVVVDCVAARRTRDGRLTLSWPKRTDRTGRSHDCIRPLNDKARQHLEREVFKALGWNEGGLAS